MKRGEEYAYVVVLALNLHLVVVRLEERGVAVGAVASRSLPFASSKVTAACEIPVNNAGMSDEYCIAPYLKDVGTLNA